MQVIVRSFRRFSRIHLGRFAAIVGALLLAAVGIERSLATRQAGDAPLAAQNAEFGGGGANCECADAARAIFRALFTG